MRTTFGLLFFVLLYLNSYGQIDDIPDYRNKREGFTKLTDKTLRNDLASFTLGSLDEAVSKQPLQQVAIVDYGNDYIKFANDNILINISAGVFDKTKHKLLFHDDKYLVRIDNKPYWGIYGQVPKKTIRSVTVVMGRDSVNIPAIAYADLYEPLFCQANSNSNTARCNCAVYISDDKRRLYIYMLNSNGTNGYEVTWIIQDKQYLRRVVDYGF